MELRGISIPSIPVSDQERAKDFYINTLGFGLVVDEAQDDQRWIEVRPLIGDAALALVNWFPTMPPGSLKGTAVSCDDTDRS